MKTIRPTFSVLLLLLLGVLVARADDDSTNTLTRVGQFAPAFQCTTLDGRMVVLSEMRGKVVLVNFFATWCGPCNAEMPRLEKQVWKEFKDQKFLMLALGREHENKELRKFQKKYHLTFPVAGDPGRAIFSQYAKQSIPRNYVIDADGKIVFQSVGFDEKELARMMDVIRGELARTK